MSTRRADPAGTPPGGVTTPPVDADRVVVGRIGRAHGLLGEVAVTVLTDVPEQRFHPGAQLVSARGPLTVSRVRSHHGRLLITFAGVDDRDAAEQLAGVVLQVSATGRDAPGENEWWDSDLVGLQAMLPDGSVLGTIVEVVHLSAQDLLAVRDEGSRERLIPFVTAIVPVVDLSGGKVHITPPEGLLEL